MRKMSNYFTFLMLNILLLVFTACDDEDPGPEAIVLEVNTVEDLDADGSYAFYDLEGDATLTSADSASTKWDLAFNGTTILINGGISGPGVGAAQIVEGVFEEIEEAPASGYEVDSESTLAIPTGGGNGWYTYTGMTGTPAHAILPIPGRIIVLKTGGGNYAKVEIISYYQGNPDTSTEEFADTNNRVGKYYTFRYLVQPDGSRNFEAE